MQELDSHAQVLYRSAKHVLSQSRTQLELRQQLLSAYDPQTALKRGYALVRLNDTVVRSGADLKAQDKVEVQLADARLTASVLDIIYNSEK
jgi:exonuclease VII large subunit